MRAEGASLPGHRCPGRCCSGVVKDAGLSGPSRRSSFFVFTNSNLSKSAMLFWQCLTMLVLPYDHMKSSCRLDRMLHVNENIILQATLEEFEDSRDNMSYAMLQREKVSVGEEGIEEGAARADSSYLLEVTTDSSCVVP